MDKTPEGKRFVVVQSLSANPKTLETLYCHGREELIDWKAEVKDLLAWIIWDNGTEYTSVIWQEEFSLLKNYQVLVVSNGLSSNKKVVVNISDFDNEDNIDNEGTIRDKHVGPYEV